MDLRNEQERKPVPQPAAPHLMIPSRCVILVPFATYVAPACEQGLIELQRRGYEVWRVGGYAAIDQGRNQMATDALAAGFDETFWIDSDIEFHPDAVERLRSYGLPITSGVYARKGARALGSQTLPGTAKLGVGKGGGLCEILYAGAGFLHVRREVYRTIQERLALPIVQRAFRKADGALLPADGSRVGRPAPGTWPRITPSASGRGSADSRSWPTRRSACGTSASTPTAGKTPGWNARGTIRSSS